MLHSTTTRKKPKSPGVDVVSNPKTSVTCTNVPEALFEAGTAKKHFSKFGRLQKIRLLPKRQACIVEYEQPISAERAVLNAGAFDGFMFDVTRTKQRLRKRSTSVKKDDDPDWVPDSDVEDELSAMQGAPTSQIVTRNKSMDTTPPMAENKQRVILRSPQSTPIRKKVPVTNKTVLQKKAPIRERPVMKSQAVSGLESPVIVTAQTTLSTSEAAAELHQLRYKVALTADEQWRLLDARDRILRGWGGAGSRVKVGGATIGTCRDMCPEKELLHRQAEHQVMTLETVVESDGQLEPWRAVKQYSRSSADQEIPMCYELRPARVLTLTCTYLLHEIADTQRQVALADWFHFMWDRFRSIRKDITQQALCCAESIRLVEMCARFHAHCAARLADLEHTQFDQKLNTDNLTKCLQTLKHMYADVAPDKRPREAEFRGYIALLNLGDANFWWEIKQLPHEMQKSAPIVFAIKIFNALDNNNYVKFFRLVRQEATYLQACILLRYFNDVRARALARIVKAYAPKGGARFPAEELMNTLAFESLDKMKAFIMHYGLRFGRIEEHEPSIILSKHQFIEDSDPFPTARAINLIESKRQCSVGEVIAGGPLPSPDYRNHVLHTSFSKDGRLKDSSLVAEEQEYNTINDSNKDITLLKAELERLARGGRVNVNIVDMNTQITVENKARPEEEKGLSPRYRPPVFAAPQTFTADKKLFSFKPAIIVEPTSPDKLLDTEASEFSFSKPQQSPEANLFSAKDTPAIFGLTRTIENKSAHSKGLFGKVAPASNSVFDSKDAAAPKTLFRNTELKGLLNASTAPEPKGLFQTSAPPSKGLFQNQQESKSLFQPKASGSNSLFDNKASSDPKNLFGSKLNEKSDPFKQNVFKITKPEESLFSKPDVPKSIFGQKTDATKPESGKTMFGNNPAHSINDDAPKNIFAAAKEKSLFAKTNSVVTIDKGSSSIFAKATQETQDNKQASQIFAGFSKESEPKNIFAKAGADSQKTAPSIFASNRTPPGQVSPGNFFKSVLNPPNGEDKAYSIFQSKNKAQTVADNILNSVNATNNVYEFNLNEEDQNQMRLKEEQMRQEREIQRLEEERRQQELLHQKEMRRQAELRRQEEMRQEEIRRQDEARRKQEELRLMEERKREEKRKQEELRRKLEEEKKAEMKRLAEEKERKFRESVNIESKELVEELVNEINTETSQEIIKEEQEKLRVLMKFANDTSEEIVTEFCKEICEVEMKAEMFLTQKIMKKWFNIWRQQLYRNLNRRRLLDDTPVWLPQRTPIEEASCLRSNVENAALKNMNDFHKGYRFSGELKSLPQPQPYNLIDIIRSPLLKRMKEISYQFVDCFFWKVTLVTPGEDKWLCRKINIKKWLVDAFSDKKKHEESDTLIHVDKQSWNHLMEFAISVSLVNAEKMINCGEAVEGTNGILFFATERDTNLEETVQHTLRLKYPYQIVPVAIIMPRTENVARVQNILSTYVENKIISGFKIFLLESDRIDEHLNVCTKSAIKWLAKKYPHKPPLEVDHLKSICQRYLGNEIWCKLRIEPDGRMREVRKDIHKLIRCYNEAVDRLATVISNEDLFNYASFPLEFSQFLDHTTHFPKSYEYIPSSARTSENASTIRDILRQLKLPNPSTNFNPMSLVSMQQQIRTYCNQIGWFEDPEEVVCKVVAIIPDELTDENMSCKDFMQCFANYNLTDFLNIIVYEKINRLNRFDDRFAIYDKSVLKEYCTVDWLYEVEVISQMKHKAIEYEDEIDYLIEAKRRKITEDSLEYLMLEDKDQTLVEDSIQEANASITRINTYSDAVKQLEREIEEGKKKSVEFEKMLRAALADV